MIDASAANPRRYWLYRISAISAMILDALFLLAAIGLIITVLRPDGVDNRLMLIQNNWLVILFKLNMRFDGVHFGLIEYLNLLDSSLLVLAGVMFVGLYPTLRPVSKTWVIVALAQPVAGLLIFIITGVAGRLGIMSGMLIFSAIMLKSDRFKKVTALIGILAGALLIVGDGFSAAALSMINAINLAVGYVLMLVWLFVVGRKLFRLGPVNPPPAVGRS